MAEAQHCESILSYLKRFVFHRVLRYACQLLCVSFRKRSLSSSMRCPCTEGSLGCGQSSRIASTAFSYEFRKTAAQGVLARSSKHLSQPSKMDRGNKPFAQCRLRLWVVPILRPFQLNCSWRFVTLPLGGRERVPPPSPLPRLIPPRYTAASAR